MNGSKLFTTKEAADFLGRRPATLRSWRYRHVGPKFWSPIPGAPVLYAEADLTEHKAKMENDDATVSR